MPGMDGDEVCTEESLPMAGPLDGPMTEGSPLRWRRFFKGDPCQVSAVRQWLRSLLPECPALADVQCVASELATNAIQYTLSGERGWFGVDVTVRARQAVRLAVADGGGHGSPRIIAASDCDHCPGLPVVAGLATR